MHPQANDYQMPCGCHRVTRMDKHGRIESIDEAICAKHLRPMWDALPVLSKRFPVTTRENTEAIAHDPEV